MTQGDGAEDEKEMNLSDGQMSMLEQMLRSYAQEHFERAQRYPGGVKAYFHRMVSDVTTDYRNERLIMRNIYDFSVDRYLFYRRHKEMDDKDAIQEAYIDTFEYLVQLKNDFPMLSPPMKDDWRH